MKSYDDGRWEIGIDDPEYPPAFTELANPPGVIYGVGDASCLQTPCLGIIGARRATPYGLAIASMAGRVAAEGGVCVVSGGAMGCDVSASRSALAAGGSTIVVSGCGADTVYPSTSEDVFRGAADGGGAVISAERWGMGPRRYAFPKRNALIAALSRCLVVTEAGPRSGTMGTADAAIELGRTVYAIPGSIFSLNSKGTNSLIAEGAKIIPDEESLALAISLDFGFLRLQSERPQEEADDLMAALLASPSRPDELADALGADVMAILRELTGREARNLVERLPDGRYAPSQTYLLGHNVDI